MSFLYIFLNVAILQTIEVTLMSTLKIDITISSTQYEYQIILNLNIELTFNVLIVAASTTIKKKNIDTISKIVYFRNFSLC